MDAVTTDGVRLTISPVAQSVGHAFARGVTWSPGYHRAWLRRDAKGALPADFTPVLLEEPRPDAAPPPPPSEETYEEITAENLFKLLVEFKAKLEKSELDDIERRVGRIELELRGISATRLHVTDGPLNLTGFVLPTPIKLRNCRFDKGIILDDARLGPLVLSRSEFPWLNADAVRIDGNFGLYGLKKTEWINLRGAKIAGSLSLGATTLNPEKTDLKPTKGRALNCGAATIGASVFLGDGFSAEGEVNFIRATITGQLNCEGGRFKNNKGRALYCDTATIGADVYLRDGFCSDGEANFWRATIGGHLQCHEASFTAPCEDKTQFYAALNLQGATVNGTLYLTRLSKTVDGRLDLRDATIERFADDGTAWERMSRGNLRLDGLRYEAFADDWAVGQLHHYKNARKTATDHATRKLWLETQLDAAVKDKGFKPQPWTQCAKVLHAMGHTQDANKLLEERDARLVRNQGPVTRCFYMLLWPFAGYGRELGRAFWWALVMILLGWLIFAGAEERALFTPAQDKHVAFSPLIYTFDVFFPAVDLHQEQDWVIVESATDTTETPALRCPADLKRFGGDSLVTTCAAAAAVALPFVPSYRWITEALITTEILMGWWLLFVIATGLAGVLQHKTE